MGLRCGVRYLRRGDEASAGAEGLNDLNGAVKYERALGHRAAKTPEGACVPQRISWPQKCSLPECVDVCGPLRSPAR